MKCVICDSEIEEQKWAIRDYSGNESYIQWIIRHLKRLVTLGFYKYISFALPVCEHCVSKYSKKPMDLEKDE